jgi:hypothetical protein
LLQDVRVVVREVAVGSMVVEIEFLPLATLLWVGLALIVVAVPVAAWPRARVPVRHHGL